MIPPGVPYPGSGWLFVTPVTPWSNDILLRVGLLTLRVTMPGDKEEEAPGEREAGLF